MANPFGIEQVDIPSLLGMHAQMKRQRLQDLYTAREMDMKDRKEQREEQRLGAIAKVFSGPGASAPATSPEPAAAPSAVQTADVPPSDAAGPLSQDEGNAIIAKAHASKTIMPSEADRVRRSLGPNGGGAFEKWMTDNGIEIEGAQGGPEVAPASPLPPLDQDLPPRTDGLTINQEALRELYAYDFDTAAKIQKAVYDSDEQSLKAMTKRGEAMANVAHHLSSLPANERPAEFQRWAPYLTEHGLPAQALRQADLSDNGLQRYFQQGRQIEQIVQSDEKAGSDAESRRRWEIGEARAARAEGRAAVRFEERDLDRKALAASGGRISTDTSDLDY